MLRVRSVIGLLFAAVLLACPGRSPRPIPGLPDGSTAIPVPPQDNTYRCVCNCDVPLDRIDGASCVLGGGPDPARPGFCLGQRPQEVCIPATLNPNTNDPSVTPPLLPPTMADIINDCAVRGRGIAEEGLRFLYRGCAHPDPTSGSCLSSTCSISCACSPELDSTGEHINSWVDRRCNNVCPRVPLVPNPSNLRDPYGNITLATEVDPPGYGPDCPIASAVGPACSPNLTRPAHSPPDGLLQRMFGHFSSGTITSGTALVTIGERPAAMTVVRGTVDFTGGPCPGSSCAITMAYHWTVGDFTSGPDHISNIVGSGAGFSGAAVLDAAGHGRFEPGQVDMTGRATGLRIIAGVPVSGTEAWSFPNSGPIDVTVDWTSRTFRLDDEFFLPAGLDPESAPSVRVSFHIAGSLLNQPPTADAGADQIVECSSPNGTDVTLDGRGSADPDSNIQAYLWTTDRSGNQVVVGGTPISTTRAALGTSGYGLGVVDGFDRTAVDQVTVEVVDTTPPAIADVVVVPNCLWPPNHRYVAFRLGHEVRVDVHDRCSLNTTVRIVSVVSDQQDDAPGPGDRPGENGDGATTDDVLFGRSGFCLRSERAAAGGHGRSYLVTLEAVDGAGNVARHVVTVVVPHDEREHCPVLSESSFVPEDDARLRCSFDEAPEVRGDAGAALREPPPDGRVGFGRGGCGVRHPGRTPSGGTILVIAALLLRGRRRAIGRP